MTPVPDSVRLGLRANLAQFSLLVVVNAFVGAMVGMERTLLPPIAEQEFHLAAKSAVLSFIVVFGVTKALTNYLAGRLSDRFGRKHVLVGGWLVAAPVPFLLMWAPTWTWVLIANALLVLAGGFAGFATGAALLGVGTAMVYPTLLAAIGDVAHPAWRASAVGVYRLWRDLGYAIGAVLAGLIADALGLPAAIWVVAGLTFASGVVVAVRMTETLRRG